MITSIKFRMNSFHTSTNIKIGSRIDEVVNVYGTPTYITSNDKGEIIYQFEQFIEEINIEGEYTLIQFKVFSNRVVEILIDIVISV
jgi:hypothetical protein